MAEERVLSGRYALRDVVGTGGMSVVYRAWDLQEGRIVAVKVLRSEFAGDEQFAAQFANEAHAAQQMHHPNIVDIYGLGQDGDTRYIAMQFVEGVTLKEMIRQEGRIAPRRAVTMAIRILAAVDHAHRNHIIHRDIKPQNIIVDADYNVKVTDFGIARRIGKDAAAIDPGTNILGSVHYFSPEQAQGRVADEKSDLYSVGVVLYEMLTGQVPFDGEDARTVALKHVREMPPVPSAVQKGISPALDEVIARALSKDAASRYQTAAEMAADLKRALVRPRGGFVRVPGKEEAPAPQEKLGRETLRRYLRKFGLLAIAVLVVAGIALAGLVLGRDFYRRTHGGRKAPALRGYDIETAADLLDESGLPYTIVEAESEDVPLGAIIAQTPEAGEALGEGERITLYVCTGSDTVRVPDVLGQTAGEAQAHLEAAGLTVGSVTYAASEQTEGTVVTQTPEGGMFASEETAVNLVLSGRSAIVPDVTGMSLEDAQILLEVNGFAAGAITYQKDAFAPDTVLSQSLAGDTSALMGAEVDLTVSELDPASSFKAQVELHLAAEKEGDEVRLVLVDADGSRTALREALAEAGEQVVSITLYSRYEGMHTVEIYLAGELAAERLVEFR